MPAISRLSNGRSIHRARPLKAVCWSRSGVFVFPLAKTTTSHRSSATGPDRGPIMPPKKTPFFGRSVGDSWCGNQCCGPIRRQIHRNFSVKIFVISFDRRVSGRCPPDRVDPSFSRLASFRSQRLAFVLLAKAWDMEEKNWKIFLISATC